MLLLGHVIHRFDISYNFYADDTQLYISFTQNDPEKLATTNNRLPAIKEWMTQTFSSLIVTQQKFFVSVQMLILNWSCSPEHQTRCKESESDV
ncbi:hypothetical protein LDENG_00152850 [Lucifuga dentata]|nr:hypothetical protein LDENG_00152850 [Lucifuga dentata]